MYQAMSGRIALYREEVACLKKRTGFIYGLEERLDLPEEAVAGAAKLTVTSGRRAFIENHRGVLEYGTERIVVGTESGKLILSGTELGIWGMDRHELLIGGKLQHAEWE